LFFLLLCLLLGFLLLLLLLWFVGRLLLVLLGLVSVRLVGRFLVGLWPVFLVLLLPLLLLLLSLLVASLCRFALFGLLALSGLCLCLVWLFRCLLARLGVCLWAGSVCLVVLAVLVVVLLCLVVLAVLACPLRWWRRSARLLLLGSPARGRLLPRLRWCRLWSLLFRLGVRFRSVALAGSMPLSVWLSRLLACSRCLRSALVGGRSRLGLWPAFSLWLFPVACGCRFRSALAPPVWFRPRPRLVVSAALALALGLLWPSLLVWVLPVWFGSPPRFLCLPVGGFLLLAAVGGCALALVLLSCLCSSGFPGAVAGDPPTHPLPITHYQSLCNSSPHCYQQKPRHYYTGANPSYSSKKSLGGKTLAEK
jgi:hypothetical protein